MRLAVNTVLVALLFSIMGCASAQRQSRHSNSCWLYYTAAGDLLERAEYDRAAVLIRERLATHPNCPQGHFLDGVLAYHQQQWGHARQAFQKAENLAPWLEKVYTGPYLKTLDEKELSNK